MQCQKLRTYMETGRVVFLPAKAIRPNPAQPRELFRQEELSDLAESIRQHGILQPLSVRRVGVQYELIAGERRLRAAQQQRLHRSRQQFVGLTAKLDAMSPLKVLSRGYALAAKADGTLVRSASQVAPGDRLSITLHEGSITATVQEESK